MRTVQILSLPVSDSLHTLEIEKLTLQLRTIQIKLDQLLLNQQQQSETMITIFSSGHYHQTKVCDIVMVRAENNYSTIYLDGGRQLFTSRTLKYWQAQCNSEDLVRIHHSYLVHKQKIISIDTKLSIVALPDGQSAPYSRMSKSNLLHLIGQSIRHPKNTFITLSICK